MFLTSNWKRIFRDKIQVFKNDQWFQFCDTNPDMYIAQTYFENVSPQNFWSIADEYLDLGYVYTDRICSDPFGIGSTLFIRDRFETGTVWFHIGSPS